MRWDAGERGEWRSMIHGLHTRHAFPPQHMSEILCSGREIVLFRQTHPSYIDGRGSWMECFQAARAGTELTEGTPGRIQATARLQDKNRVGIHHCMSYIAVLENISRAVAVLKKWPRQIDFISRVT